MRLSLALIVLALFATPASAEEVTLRVAYDDLDLTSEYEVAALKARIADAATEACAPAKDWVLSNASAANCETTLTRKALAEVETLRAEAARP